VLQVLRDGGPGPGRPAWRRTAGEVIQESARQRPWTRARRRSPSCRSG
jgi:hypothetical protein